MSWGEKFHFIFCPKLVAHAVIFRSRFDQTVFFGLLQVVIFFMWLSIRIWTVRMFDFFRVFENRTSINNIFSFYSSLPNLICLLGICSIIIY